MSDMQLPHRLCAAQASGGFAPPPSNLFSSPWAAQLSLAPSQEIALLAILVKIARGVMWSRGTEASSWELAPVCRGPKAPEDNGNSIWIFRFTFQASSW